MPFTHGAQIYNMWVKAWNEDISVLEEITSSDCVVHQARMDGKSSNERKGPAALNGIIAEGCKFFDHVNMAIEVGPIVDGPYVSARWIFTGFYIGGIEGAQADIGEKMSFNGMDIFFVKDGKIMDYWVSSDGIYLMEQLRMF
ncbi:ester cyclase [Thalassobacillus sp. CUG 92003]|uniref:ester cyclase n=1 Tax=Thalassobacillus sp. CUG 92003 TaxID=2736641 RepID=UPI00210730C6|nr:ester cyclase [Thalassobacillus sp. CUG 92003]